MHFAGQHVKIAPSDTKMSVTFSKINIFQIGENWARFETHLFRFLLFSVCLGLYTDCFEEKQTGDASKKVIDSSLNFLIFD